MNMEKLLGDLFDYQRFERNEALQRVIDEAQTRLPGAELTDDELEKLAAAGDPFLQTPDRRRKDGLP